MGVYPGNALGALLEEHICSLLVGGGGWSIETSHQRFEAVHTPIIPPLEAKQARRFPNGSYQYQGEVG